GFSFFKSKAYVIYGLEVIHCPAKESPFNGKFCLEILYFKNNVGRLLDFFTLIVNDHSFGRNMFLMSFFIHKVTHSKKPLGIFTKLRSTGEKTFCIRMMRSHENFL